MPGVGPDSVTDSSEDEKEYAMTPLAAFKVRNTEAAATALAALAKQRPRRQPVRQFDGCHQGPLRLRDIDAHRQGVGHTGHAAAVEQ